MSQYPSPYYPPNVQPPYYPYGGAVDVLAPAKRASMMMFILGPLLLLCGGCFISMPFMISSMPPDQSRPMLDKIEAACHAPAQTVLPIAGVMILLPGIAMLILAFFVRRGGRVSAILSMVIVGLILILSIISVLVGLTQPMSADIASSVCMHVVNIGIFGTLLLWLIQAVRASSSVSRAQQQYLAQYWQYQQNMQAYSGYGYATPPQEGQPYQPAPPQPAPLAPPQPPATPPDNSPPPTGG